jgi:hypothetical protein
MSRNRKGIAPYILWWLAAAGVAVVCAAAGPSDSSVMGHMPAFMARTLSQKSFSAPSGLPSDRTLALVTFERKQREQAESWIEGLHLKDDARTGWMRVLVFNDPGDATAREATESRLMQRYPSLDERARLVPVFTDRDNFVRAAGLRNVEQSYALVVNRRGEVLARVQGRFDADKAQSLRETLAAPGP